MSEEENTSEDEDRCNTHNNPTFVLDGRIVCPKCVEENKKHMPSLWRKVQARLREKK